MKRAKHGGNIYEIANKLGLQKEEIMDYSANINPLGVPESFKKALLENIEIIENYPDVDYTLLIDAISDYNDINSQYITVGNGATEVIFSIIGAIKPKRSLLLAPTFSEYERALKKFGSQVDYYYLKENDGFQVTDEFFDKIDGGYDLILLCNPNNPTGQLIDRDRMDRVLKHCRENDMHLMIDEAFIDFVDQPKEQTMISYIHDYNKLYIIRALTKFFAIPGLRIGYGITSNTKLLNIVNDFKEPWTINSYAALAGEVVLKDDGYIQKSRKWIYNERERFYHQLKEIEKIKVYRPAANYILFQLLDHEKNIVEKLLEKRFLIRNCSNYHNLEGAFFRVAVKDSVTNNAFVKAFKEVLYEG